MILFMERIPFAIFQYRPALVTSLSVESSVVLRVILEKSELQTNHPGESLA